jgi:hypothetical protein
MTTHSPTRRPKAAPVRTSRLLLAIGDTYYTVRRLGCDAWVGRESYQLLKTDGTVYDVVQTRYGAECDCPDFIFRREGIDPSGCKHVKALVAAGLLEPSPAMGG